MVTNSPSISYSEVKALLILIERPENYKLTNSCYSYDDQFWVIVDNNNLIKAENIKNCYLSPNSLDFYSSRLNNESPLVVGIVIGLLLFHTNSAGVSPLTPTTFFFYMLPPIILDAGYFMPNRLFFDHLGTILLFAVIGTIWNTVSIGNY